MTTIENNKELFEFLLDNIKEVHLLNEIICMTKQLELYLLRDKLLLKYNNDWELLSKKEKNLSEDFMREFQDKIEWYYIIIYQKLSEDFIREFQNKVYWYFIGCHQVLSGDFLREFHYKINWKCISYCQNLSEDFIREFSDKVYWEHISRYQILTEDFKLEFRDFL